MNDPLVINTPTSDATFNPVDEGVRQGLKAAFLLALLYIIGVLFCIIVIDWLGDFPENLRDMGEVVSEIANVYSGVLFVVGIGVVIGAIPALMIGVLFGGIIGFTFRFIKHRLNRPQSFLYGFVLSLSLLMVRIWVGEQILGMESSRDLLIWVFWFIPNVVAFFGFWWVAYQVNKKLPASALSKE